MRTVKSVNSPDRSYEAILEAIVDEYRSCINLVEEDGKLYCYTWWKHDDCERIRELLYRITNDELYTLPKIGNPPTL